MSYVYIDGHVRLCRGSRDLHKAHVTRGRISAPATLETSVGGKFGDPVFVVIFVHSASPINDIRRLLTVLKTLASGRRMTVIFDRGCWSPDLSTQMVVAGIDFLTYRKGKTRKEPASAFGVQTFVEDSIEHHYEPPDRGFRLKLSKKVGGAKTLRCRQVTRRRVGTR